MAWLSFAARLQLRRLASGDPESQILDLERERITVQKMRVLARAIATSAELRSVRMRSCAITNDGYALLAAYRLSRDPMWLHRAVVFGTCIGDDAVCARQRTPDNPYSLFEGLAGSACFLRDLRESRLGAGLPLFEVDVG